MGAERPLGTPSAFNYIRPLILPGLLFVALVLRLWHIRHGLPDFLEEATPLRLALRMRSGETGEVDWNPHLFNDPSLAVYVHFFVQQLVFAAGAITGHWKSYADYLMAFQLDPSVMVVASRLVGIACDALSLIAVVRLGHRFGFAVSLIAGLFVAFAPASIVASRSIFAGSVMTACFLWSIERMLAWHDRGGSGRLAGAAALAGLAIGSKYPAAILLAPLAWLVWRREARGGRGVATAGGAVVFACGLAIAAFLATTPFALLDFQAFARDFAFESWNAAPGALGELESGGAAVHIERLSQNLGGPSVLLVACSIGFMLFDPRMRITAVALWLGLAGLGIPIVLARLDTANDLLPVIAIAAVLGAAALRATVSPFRTSVRRGMLAVLLAATTGSSVIAGIRTAWVGSDTTQLEARRWCERFLRPGDVLVQETHSARLLSESALAERESSPEFRLASEDVRSRLTSQRSYRVVTIPPSSPGAVTNLLYVPGRAPRTVELFPRDAEFIQVFFDPRLFAAADYVMTSAEVRGRFEAQPRLYAGPCGLYRLLDATGEVVARFKPRAATDGPEIVVYRIGSRYRAAVETLGALDSLWWTRCIPSGYRSLATRALAPASSSLARRTPPAGPRSGDGAGQEEFALAHSQAPAPDSTLANLFAAPATDIPSSKPAGVAAKAVRARGDSLAPIGELPPWVRSLTPLYDTRIRRFTDQMSAALARSGRFLAAERFALSTLIMHPDDIASCMAYSVSARAAGHFAQARAAIERTLAMRSARPPDPAIRLEYARVLQALGERERARAELAALTAISDRLNPVAAEARRMLATTE